MGIRALAGIIGTAGLGVAGLGLRAVGFRLAYEIGKDCAYLPLRGNFSKIQPKNKERFDLAKVDAGKNLFIGLGLVTALGSFTTGCSGFYVSALCGRAIWLNKALPSLFNPIASGLLGFSAFVISLSAMKSFFGKSSDAQPAAEAPPK